MYLSTYIYFVRISIQITYKNANDYDITELSAFFSFQKGWKRATRVSVRSPPLAGHTPTNEQFFRVAFSFTWRFQVWFLPPVLILTQVGSVARKSSIAKVVFSIVIERWSSNLRRVQCRFQLQEFRLMRRGSTPPLGIFARSQIRPFCKMVRWWC